MYLTRQSERKKLVVVVVGVDDVIGGLTKTAQHSIENNSRNIKAVFFKLGTSNVHHKET